MLLMPRSHSAWGQRRSRGEGRRQLARQTFEEGNHVANFRIPERYPELHTRHNADRFGQRRHRPIVKVWRCHRDVAQAGNAEDIKIAEVLRHIHASRVDGPASGYLPIVLDHTKLLVHAAADAAALVASGAAGIDKRLEARAGHWRKSIDVAGEISVERRRRDQGPLMCADRIRRVARGHWSGLVRERRLEQREIARNLSEPVDNGLRIRLTGCDRRYERFDHLILEALAIASPVNDV